MTTFERLVELSLWMLARSDNFSFSANVITYKDKFGIPDNDNPMFLQSIIFSPAYAFIPRTVWRSKPRDQIGAWYEDTILQSPFSVLQQWALGAMLMSQEDILVQF